MKIETERQLNKTIQALAETGTLIAKEENYSDDLQKKDYLASLKKHADKLIGMIEEYRNERNSTVAEPLRSIVNAFSPGIQSTEETNLIHAYNSTMSNRR